MNLLEPKFEDFEKIHDFFSSNNDFHFHLETVQVAQFCYRLIKTNRMTDQKVRIWTEKSLKKCRHRKKTKLVEDFPKNIEIVIGKLDHCAYAGIYERESETVNGRPGTKQWI